MRLLDEPVRENLLDTVCDLLATNTGFYLGAGGCDKRPNVEIIDGEVEGLYGWLGLNYLAGSLVSKVDSMVEGGADELADVKNPHDESRLSQSSPLGFMDMGGASAQIAFVPNATETSRHLDDLYQVRLRSVNGQLQEWNVFVSTWLGFGANEARRRYLETLPAVEGVISDPCLMKGLKMDYGKFEVVGGGDFSECMASASPLLMKHLPCTDHPCLFNGVHAPALDFSVTKFIGISEYWYTSADIFGLREEDYNFHVFSQKTREYCTRDWNDIVSESEGGGFNKISRDKLQVACFKATWVLTILHEGFGVPIGPGELSEEDSPFVSPFKSLETFDDQELSWTLGKMVLYSSSQVPAARNSDNREVGVGYVPSMLDGSTIVIPGGEGRTRDDVGLLSLPLVFLLVIAFGVVYFLLGKTKVTGGIINQVSRLSQRLRWKKTFESVDLESGPYVPATCRSSSALDLSEMRSSTPRLQTSQSSVNIPSTGRFKGLGMNSRAPSRSSSATRLAEEKR
ncbi:Golgi apyrase [Yarrowia sp. C11]|nr:Golgi apyrase [Yarrowia sp. C11]